MPPCRFAITEPIPVICMSSATCRSMPCGKCAASLRHRLTARSPRWLAGALCPPALLSAGAVSGFQRFAQAQYGDLVDV
jgi:hypothetical protein